MGVMADRAMKFVIAASIPLVLMSLQGWQRSDWYGTIHGTDVDGLTGIGDGGLVLLGAAAACVLALVALVHPASRRASGIAIGLLGTAMLAVTAYDILYLPGVPSVLLWLGNPNGDGHYYATPLLYFAAVTSFLIGIAGLTMALAPRDGTGNKHEQQETPAWA
jgi:hypothetical protein